jgi:uncharacterized protein YbbK (DUF523 family)
MLFSKTDSFNTDHFMKKILASACLIGKNCKYDGGNNLVEAIKALYEKGEVIPVCPEMLGGLPALRPPCEIVEEEGGQKVMGKDGNDYTAQFKKGAMLTLKEALKNDISLAILKARSPSCGSSKIYDGTFSGRLIDGNGIMAQLLIDNGIKVITENGTELF